MSDFNARIIDEFRSNGGSAGPFGTDLVLLHSTGAKSGVERIHPVLGIRDGDGWLIAASKGGAPEHPGWYLNLLAHPDDVTVQIKGDLIPVRARTAEGDERTELWNLMLEPWPEYAGYQANTDREIPVVVLERR